MQEKIKNLIFNLFTRLFIKSNILPPFLLVVEQCIQFGLYALILHNPSFINVIITGNQNSTTIGILLIILILVKIVLQISIFKIFYPIMLYVLINIVSTQAKYIIYLKYFLIAMLLVSDVCSNIRLDFNPNSVTSETLNFTKVIHLVTMVLGIVYSSTNPNQTYFHLISAALFFTIAIFKRASSMRNDHFKQILLRLYLLLALDHVCIFIDSLYTLPLVTKIFFPIVASQLIYQLYKAKKWKVKIEELYSQEKYFQMSFLICKYISGKIFDKQIQQELAQFMSDEIKGYMKNCNKKILIYQKLITILSRQQSFHNYLLLTLIHINFKHQLLNAGKLICKMKLNAKCNPIEKLLIFRAQEIYENQFYQKNSIIKFEQYESLFKCDQFRTLLLKSSIHSIQYWQYTLKSQIDTIKLRNISNKAVDFQRKIDQTYRNIQTKCLSISLLYVSYLFEVANDKIKARKILQKLSFNEDFEVNMKINQKIFLRLNLIQQTLRIDKIGYNASLFLGYQRKELQNKNLSVFFPNFYVDYHKNIVQQIVQNQFQVLHLFQKKTIIKNKWNYYQQSNIMLRLRYQIGGNLQLQGYIQIKTNPRYIWSNYFFINDKKQVIQCCQSLSHLSETHSKIHKITEQFTQQNYYLTKTTSDQTQNYFPLIKFPHQKQTLTYYVKVNEDCNTVSTQLANQRITTLLNAIERFKQNIQFNKTYFQSLSNTIANITAKQYIILLVCIVVISLGILVCISLFYYTMTIKQNIQNTIFDNTTLLINFTSVFNSLGIQLDYIDLNQQFNYSNNYVNMNLINDSITFQNINQQLEFLNISNFQLPSFLPNVTYNKSGFDAIMQLSSNSYMIQQFSDDFFMQNLSLSRARISLQPIAADIIYNYRQNYINIVSNTTFPSQLINYILFALLFILFLAIEAIIVRCQFKMRNNQTQTLSLILTVRQQDQLIDSIKIFMSKITKQEVNFKSDFIQNKSKMLKNETSFAPDVTATAREGGPRSQISMRELSGRNLMDDTLNKSSFIQAQQTNRSQPKAQLPMHNVQISPSPIKRRNIIIPAIIIVVLFTLIIANQIKNDVVGNIDQAQSTNNLFLLNRQGKYFGRSVIAFINSICLKNLGYPINSTYFKTYFGQSYEIQNAITFQEATIAEFAQFQDRIVNFEYQYMCVYMTCQPQFANEINIVYTGTIQKLLTLMNNYVVIFEQQNITSFKSLMASSKMKYDLDLIIYSQKIIHEWLQETYQIYNRCYSNYLNNIVTSKTIFTSLTLLLGLVGIVFLIMFTFNSFHNQRYLQDIAKLVKIDQTVSHSNTNEECQKMQQQSQIA